MGFNIGLMMLMVSMLGLAKKSDSSVNKGVVMFLFGVRVARDWMALLLRLGLSYLGKCTFYIDGRLD